MRYPKGKPARLLAGVLATAFMLGALSQAGAVVFSFSGPSNNSGDTLSATAEFIVSGTTLTIILTNTADSAATDGADVLDGLFFDIAGSPEFLTGDAQLTAGSELELRDAASTSGNDLNDEWMFDSPVPFAWPRVWLGRYGVSGVQSESRQHYRSV